MKAILVVFGSIAALFLALVLSVVGMYVSNANYANTMENRIVAQYDVNLNVLSNYTTRIMEMAQIPAMARDDLLEVVSATFEGRYGADGSQAVFQFIQEQNMSIDSRLYERIQTSMEAGRNEFQTSQNRLIDLKRQYETSMGFVVKGFFIQLAGYPKIDLDRYNIIVEGTTQERFDTGVYRAIQLR